MLNQNKTRRTSYRKSDGALGTLTPYVVRTPRIRHLLTQTPRRAGDALRNNTVRFKVKEITLKSWKSYRVTALYNFSYSPDQLHEYSRYLTSYLEKEKKKNGGVLIGEESNYKVEFSIIKGLASSEDDNEAIKISIISKEKNGNSKDLFTGILMSVERSREYWEQLRDAKYFTVLPLFLVNGKLVFMKSIVKFLENHFSCIIFPLTFSSFDLIWMLTMWAGAQKDDGSRPVLLEYSLPLKNLQTIQYSISSSSVMSIWSSVHDVESNEMHANEVEAFISSLEKHFLTLFSVNLAHLQLSSIGTPAAAVRRNGSVKILGQNSLHYVLRHLTSLAQELKI